MCTYISVLWTGHIWRVGSKVSVAHGYMNRCVGY
jgi:hypothetical protein